MFSSQVNFNFSVETPAIKYVTTPQMTITALLLNWIILSNGLFHNASFTARVITTISRKRIYLTNRITVDNFLDQIMFAVAISAEVKERKKDYTDTMHIVCITRDSLQLWMRSCSWKWTATQHSFLIEVDPRTKQNECHDHHGAILRFLFYLFSGRRERLCVSYTRRWEAWPTNGASSYRNKYNNNAGAGRWRRKTLCVQLQAANY